MSISGEWFTPKTLIFEKINVRGSSEWIMFSLSDSNGITGYGEVTSSQNDKSITSIIAKLANNLRDIKITSDYDVIKFNNISEKDLEKNFLLATAVSGLRSSITDALSRQINLPLFLYLRFLFKKKEIKKSKVKLYANINRSMLTNKYGKADRSPENFGSMAKKARDKGIKTIKCAPFDECDPPHIKKSLPPETEHGLERIRAIKSQLELDNELYIDCHARFDENSASFVENELSNLEINWFEEPVNPLEKVDFSKKLLLNSSIPIAGGEKGYGLTLFSKMIDENIVDIVMPDIKYCGGPVEAFKIGTELENKKKGSVSMHCPSGPISLLASAHTTLAFEYSLPLEHAVFENHWRNKMLEPFEKIKDGYFEIPEGSGLGARVDPLIIELYGKKWSE